VVNHLAPSDTWPRTVSRREPANADHPMRAVTEAVAAGEDTWTPDRARQVTGLFDSLAAEWHTRDEPGRLAPLEDAWIRGGPLPTGRALELGSGTGLITPWLAERFAVVLAVDLSQAMLRLAPRSSPRVRADGAALPVPDGSIDAAVLVNAFLFPSEVDRVVAPDGVLVWVCTRGADTPIYLSADRVGDTLGTSWSGVASLAGTGSWAVFRRR
jgi:SAM-dependent methyltransferase